MSLSATYIRYMSDLHLEFTDIVLPVVATDYTILAGDIMVARNPVAEQRFRRLVAWLATECNSHVVYVPGNHEFYDGGYANMPYFDFLANEERLIDEILRALGCKNKFISLMSDKHKGMYLDKDRKIAFVGETLWTNFDNEDPLTMYAAQKGMADYDNTIRFWEKEDQSRAFTPDDALSLHGKQLNRIDRNLGSVRNIGYSTVVVTHHAPSFLSVGDKFKGHPLNGAFCSALDNHPAMQKADIWIHGHVHSAKDYRINDCNVLCNPRGYEYGNYKEETGFNPRSTFVLGYP